VKFLADLRGVIDSNPEPWVAIAVVVIGIVSLALPW
jgi:hypothetical protein